MMMNQKEKKVKKTKSYGWIYLLTHELNATDKTFWLTWILNKNNNI